MKQGRCLSHQNILSKLVVERKYYFMLLILGVSLFSISNPIQESHAVTTVQWLLDTGGGFGVVTSMGFGEGNLDGGNFVSVRVTDTDQTFHTNGVIDTISVHITSTVDPSGTTLTLTETGANTGIFEGTNFVFLTGDDRYTISQPMTVRIEDDPGSGRCTPGVIDTLISTDGITFEGAFIYSDTEVDNTNDGIALDLEETHPDSCAFESKVYFTTGPSDENAKLLQVSEGDIITVLDDFSADIQNAQIIPNKVGTGSISAVIANPSVTARYTGASVATANLQLTDDSLGGRGGGGAVLPSLVVDSSVMPGSGETGHAPVIGISETNVKVVDYGFFHNSDKYEMTDRFWTKFEKVKIDVGVPQFFGMKGTGDYPIKLVEFGLVPRVGFMHEAEVLIEVWVNNGAPKVVVKQNENIIDEAKIHSPIVEEEDCFEGSGKKDCIFIGVSNVIFLERPFFEVIGLKIVDTKGRATIVYLNDGFDFVGESLNPPKTDMKVSDIKGEGQIKVTQIDKWNNIWEDERGVLYEKNEFDTYNRITPIEVEQRKDESWKVMNRMNNNFDAKIQEEMIRAKHSFDANKIINEIIEAFGHPISIQDDRWNDEEFVKNILTQRDVAKQIWNSDEIQNKIKESFTHQYLNDPEKLQSEEVQKRMQTQIEIAKRIWNSDEIQNNISEIKKSNISGYSEPDLMEILKNWRS